MIDQPMSSQPSRLQIAERSVDDVTIVLLSGEITIDDGDLAYGRKINQLIELQRTKILVDLSDVTRIDSSGLGMLAAKVKEVRRKGGDIRLLHLTGRTQRLVAMVKLTLVFETFEDEAIALRSFALRPGV